jgi:mannitol/fructose-specific phosphotransferase system IIA component
MTTAIQPPLVEVLPPRDYPSKRAVIEAIGEVMIEVAAVTQPYVDGMLRKEVDASTMVTTEVALPHGTPDVRNAVLRNVLVVAPIPGGVEWLPGRDVRLAIGFAGTGDEAHLRLLATVARVLADDHLLARLKAGGDAPALAALFVGEAQ